MKKVVHLRIFLGKAVLYNEQGKIVSPSQIVTLTHDVFEWHNYLKNIGKSGYSKVLVEKVFEWNEKDGKYELIETPEEITNEVNEYLQNTSNQILSKEQQKIADLEAKMEKMSEMLLGKAKKSKIEDIDVVDSNVLSVNDDLATLQAKYSEQNDGKEVPPRFKNDAEWIKNKLNQ